MQDDRENVDTERKGVPMLLSVGIILLTVIAWAALRIRAPHLLVDIKHSHMICILAVEVLGLVIGISDNAPDALRTGSLIRPQPAQESRMDGLIAKNGEKSDEIRVEVAPRELTFDEARKAIAGARKEIDDTFLGKNTSADRVYRKLDVRESYGGGLVKAAWDFDDYEVVDGTGTIHLSKVSKPRKVRAICKLSCGDLDSEYELALRLIPPPKHTAFGFAWYLRREISLANRKNRTEGKLKLPNRVAGRKVTWERPPDYRGAELSGLGILIALGVIAGGRQERERKKKLRMDRLSRDYPMLVGSLALYVSAGIGVKAAFGRIADRYGREEMDGKKHPGYMAVKRLCREMDDGVGERRAYENFGKFTGHRDYERLSLLLVQNLRKGSRRMTEKLEKEEAAAFEQRKIRAKVAGEEASTKLLIPMGMLLAVVLAVMVLPSVVNMKI